MNEQLAIQTAIPLIKPAETFAANAYWDVNGWAIGYGFHDYPDGTAVQQGDTMTLDDANADVIQLATQKWNAIKRCITVNLNENQAAALIDLAYNCGEGAVCRSTLLQLINAGAPQEQITAQFEQTCVTAKGIYMSGLYTRRVDEVSLFFSNVQQYAQQNPVQILIGGAVVVGLFGFLLYRAVYKKKIA